MTADGYVKLTIERMEQLGVYKQQFAPTIERLAFLYVQRDRLEQQFEESGGDAVVVKENKFGAMTATKNPFLAARDEVYAQLLAHEKELGLTPAALKKINDGALNQQSRAGGFGAALAAFEKSRGA